MAATFAKTFTADAQGPNAWAMGDAGKGQVSTWVVQVYVASGTLAGMKFKGVLSGSALAVATYGTDLCYTPRTSGTLTSGSTGITSSGVYEVNAAGLDVYLDVDVTGASSVEVYAEPVFG